jgi:hypothetical protein
MHNNKPSLGQLLYRKSLVTIKYYFSLIGIANLLFFIELMMSSWFSDKHQRESKEIVLLMFVLENIIFTVIILSVIVLTIWDYIFSGKITTHLCQIKYN